jgi:hypothetical protein
MKTTTLYDIDEGIRDLVEKAAEFEETTDPAVVDEWLASFEEMKGERAKKLESIAHVRNSALSAAAMIDVEIARLSDLKGKQQRLADKMVSLIEWTMKNAGETEVKTELFSAKFVKNPPAMKLDKEFEQKKLNEYKIPELSEELKKGQELFSKWKKELKKTAVADYKKGGKIEGVTITQGEKLKIE